MTLNATYLEQPTPGDGTKSVTIIDVNPFGPNGEMDRRLLISKDVEPILILQLYIRADNVGHIYSVPDIHSDRLYDQVLVTTYCHVFLIDISAGILWKSSQCAIDGELITSIDNDTVLSRGEWYPLEGWESFKLDFKTGIPI